MSGGIVGHNFNPRLREGGDGTAWDNNYYIPISIHASEKEATGDWKIFEIPFRFQSTPPRRRRPGTQSGSWYHSTISIHASEKEATSGYLCLFLPVLQFQSTPPRRRRLLLTTDIIHLLSISIHASEKEATATYCDTSTIMYISSLNNFFVRYF